MTTFFARRARETPDRIGHFIYSPASSYPTPYARVVDRAGAEVHVWRNGTAQPDAGDNPPSFLRGWNHVEADGLGNLYAIVPLRALLKLDRYSNLVYQADVTAHHDLEIGANGEVYVLTESPRRIEPGGRPLVILDNAVTLLDPAGKPVREFSLYDILNTCQPIASRMRDHILSRRENFERIGYVPERRADAEDLAQLLAIATFDGSATRALRILRELPGAPCDVLHTNTIEVLAAHPAGLWDEGHLLISVRDLDLVAAIDPYGARVLWWWGPENLSGQHQPSALPSGNLLIFDNGTRAKRSRLVEIDPRDNAIVWEYTAEPPESFYTELAGGCELLPGGNILVTDAQAGRAFEVTRDKRIVWERSISADISAKITSRATLYRMSAVPQTTEIVAR